jgi:outer membrane autotransporter protein
VPVLAAQSAQVANLALDDLSSIVIGRMDTRRLLDVRAEHDQNLWFRPFGTTGSQDDEDNFPGYDIDSYGMVIGYDTNVNPEWNLGVAFAYSETQVESDSSQIDDKIDTDSYTGALYAYWSGADKTYVDMMVTGGAASNDTSRQTGAGKAEGDYDSWYTRLSSEIGRGYAVNDKMTLIPSVNVSYTYVDLDSYDESGAGGSNLSVDSSDAESLIFGIDGKMAYAMSAGALLTAHVGAGYDALTDEVEVSASFVGGGAPFTTEGDSPEEALVLAGVGAEFIASDKIEIHFNYEYEYRDSFDNNLLAATLRWKI